MLPQAALDQGVARSIGVERETVRMEPSASSQPLTIIVVNDNPADVAFIRWVLNAHVVWLKNSAEHHAASR